MVGSGYALATIAWIIPRDAFHDYLHGPIRCGLELRVEHGDELIESRLSRIREAPLLLIADELKANLIEQGWFEPQNAT
jgi:hypothetical protein